MPMLRPMRVMNAALKYCTFSQGHMIGCRSQPVYSCESGLLGILLESEHTGTCHENLAHRRMVVHRIRCSQLITFGTTPRLHPRSDIKMALACRCSLGTLNFMLCFLFLSISSTAESVACCAGSAPIHCAWYHDSV
jgi:hypothetical protein